MLFNSYEFIFAFFPLVLFVYFTLAHYKATKLATVFLVFASLVFYAYWDINYLPVLVSSMIVNYYLGFFIEHSRSKCLLIMGIIGNLAVLVFFKYTGFILSAINQIFNTCIEIPNIILPLGISFFTFTQLAYLIDAYKRETVNYNLATYSLFVTFFPHLIAGPILYHKNIIPQFANINNFAFSNKNLALGFSLFSMGLFKKVILADTLSPWVKVVFNNADKITFLEAWLGSLGYTIQIYFDFSGYSDMALGLGLMFNFILPINFNSPYKATSIIEFWRRWHITLSSFLKNYLYIPLGGNRNGHFKQIRNIMVTMLLGGLWHGAGWTYIIWGGLHGVYLVINHFWRKIGFELPNVVAWSVTFLCIVFALVFFRAHTLTDAFFILKSMLGCNGFVLPIGLEGQLSFMKKLGFSFHELSIVNGNIKREIIVILFLTVISIVGKEPYLLLQNFKPNWMWAFFISMIFSVAVLGLTNVTEFLYFQF